MAISRAQALKELLPGLNALFGLEYAKYENEHEDIYDTETSERSFEEEVKLSGFGAAPTKAEGSSMTMHKKRLQLATPTRQLLWVSPSLKKRWKTTYMIRCPHVTQKLWLAPWPTPSRLKLRHCSTQALTLSSLVMV